MNSPKIGDVIQLLLDPVQELAYFKYPETKNNFIFPYTSWGQAGSVIRITNEEAKRRIEYELVRNKKNGKFWTIVDIIDENIAKPDKTMEEHKFYVRSAIQAARDLGYPTEVVDQIKKCKTDAEVSRVMASAREHNLIGSVKRRGRNI